MIPAKYLYADTEEFLEPFQTLREGDILLFNEREPVIVVPNFDSKIIRKFYHEATSVIGDAKTIGEKAEGLWLFVSKSIINGEVKPSVVEPAPAHSTHPEQINLEKVLKRGIFTNNRQGSCKVKSPILCILYTMDRIPYVPKTGQVYDPYGLLVKYGILHENPNGGLHHWTKVKTEEGYELADPTLGIFGNYERLTKMYGYTELRHPILRVVEYTN